jgi:hypothetical protein
VQSCLASDWTVTKKTMETDTSSNDISIFSSIADVNKHSIEFSWTGECVAPFNEVYDTEITLDSLELYENNDYTSLIAV